MEMDIRADILARSQGPKRLSFYKSTILDGIAGVRLTVTHSGQPRQSSSISPASQTFLNGRLTIHGLGTEYPNFLNGKVFYHGG
jgi:hypothetical protein